MLKDWEKLPGYMRNNDVRPYYDKLKKKKFSLLLKRVFDLLISSIMILILFPLLLVLSLFIMMDSGGGIFFRQERITQYGRKFRIHKFRTMVVDAEKIGSQITVKNDKRVTKIGSKLRQYRLDELPQLLDVFLGNMSFVGTRPEATKFVEQYMPEMYATLLLPAGVTSEASIRYKDEKNFLENAEDVDEIYIHKILPEKMKYNLNSIMEFSCLKEMGTMVKTLLAVMK